MIASSFEMNHQQQQLGTQKNSQEEARDFLNSAINVNYMHQGMLSEQFQQQLADGTMVESASMLDAIHFGGALAQSNHMLRNKPPQQVIREIRKMVDKAQHPAGPSHTSVGDMNVFGRDSAADKRRRNNGLTGYVPEGMTEEQMMTFAMQESTEEKEEDDSLLRLAMHLSNEEVRTTCLALSLLFTILSHQLHSLLEYGRTSHVDCGAAG